MTSCQPLLTGVESSNFKGEFVSISRTKQGLSSASVKVGDRVAFRVAKDVRVADLVVISRGADAWGLVTAVQPKKRKGQPGKLDIAIQSVQLLTGDNAGVRAEQHSEGKRRDVGTMADLPHEAIGTLEIGIPIGSARSGPTDRARFCHDLSDRYRAEVSAAGLLRQDCVGQVAALSLYANSIAPRKILFPVKR